MNRKVIANFVIVALLIVLAFFLGLFVASNGEKAIPIIDSILTRDETSMFESRDTLSYKYINPLLECELGNELENKRLVYFKQEVEKLTSELQSNGEAEKISVYYRDLNNGPWWGINEKEEYDLASLIKIPMMIAFLEHVEKDSTLMQKKILYMVTSEYINIPLPDKYITDEPLEEGKEYTLDEVLRRMIVYSDNPSYGVLHKVITAEEFQEVYKRLGLEYTLTDEGRYILSPKQYSAMFRILYNASYLGRATSEYALGLLSKTKISSGLRPGVPETVEVAHKFGIYSNPSKEDYSLHDCGIIYYPQHPYMLCIMTKGSDVDKLESVISKISKEVYDEIDRNYKQ